MSDLDSIKKAIELKKPIRFEYNKEGKVKGKRIGNPHALFINVSTNNFTVDVYQTGGVSDSDLNAPQWRQFIIQNMDNVEIIDSEEFEAAVGYNPNSKKYSKVVIKV